MKMKVKGTKIFSFGMNTNDKLEYFKQNVLQM